jgi:hypothetical protein
MCATIVGITGITGIITGAITGIIIGAIIGIIAIGAGRRAHADLHGSPSSSAAR